MRALKWVLPYPTRPTASVASPSWLLGQPAADAAIQLVDQDAAALQFDRVPAGQQRLDGPVAGFPGGDEVRAEFDGKSDAENVRGDYEAEHHDRGGGKHEADVFAYLSVRP